MKPTSHSQMSSEQMNKAKFCLEVSVGFDVAGGAVKGNLDAKGCGSSKSNSKQGSTNSADSTKVIAIGSKPNKDGEGTTLGLSIYSCITMYFLQNGLDRTSISHR